MISGALIFLVETVFDLFTVALLLRFLLQWTRAAQRNPVGDFANALTNFAVLPARRVIPGLWGLDLATLLLAWVVQLVEVFLILQLKGYPVAAFGGQSILALVLLAGVSLLRLGLYVLIFVVIVQAIVSWINPYSPIAPVANALTRPFLRPVQRVVPPIGNVDLSPLVFIVVCQLILMVPIAYLQGMLLQLV
jgi:YggT family protein